MPKAVAVCPELRAAMCGQITIVISRGLSGVTKTRIVRLVPIERVGHSLFGRLIAGTAGQDRCNKTGNLAMLNAMRRNSVQRGLAFSGPRTPLGQPERVPA
jgi:hypothetical protein